MHLSVPSPKVFSALLAGNVKELNSFTQNELRPFLPCLSRVVLGSIPPSAVVGSTISQWDNKRKVIHALIAGMEEANAIKEYLKIDFQVNTINTDHSRVCQLRYTFDSLMTILIIL